MSAPPPAPRAAVRPAEAPFAIELRGITKRFGPVVANRGVTFGARRGTVHALVGENGAGKTTLVNVLFGLLRPDEGTILVDGREVVMEGPRTAIGLGIGMVHQHFKLVPSLTVAQNIFLGMERTRRGLVDERAQEREARALSERFGLGIDPARRVSELSVGAEQRVEILKVLARGARIVILDEPTAVLTPQESRDLFRILRGFAADGMTIVFISHHLDEVMAVSDAVTVLRDGAVVGTRPREGLTEAELVRMMVGREVSFARRPRGAAPGVPVLEAEGLVARDARSLPVLREVSFTVRASEVVGIIGVDGNGQTELAEVLSGLRRPTHGTVRLGGRAVPEADPRAARGAGLAHVPADRLRRGVDPTADIAANVVMGRQEEAPFARRGLLLWRRVWEAAAALVSRFDIRASGPHHRVGKLSGGNMQKVVLAREFSHHAPFLLVDQPTRGVDIGAMEGIHDEIMRRREAGAAILLISVQIDEVLTLADRILVMFQGRIAGELDEAAATEEAIGRLMAGGAAEAAPQRLAS